MKEIGVQKIEQGPIRHPMLPPALVSRIENVARVLAEVDSQPVGDRVEDFQRDHNPENEVIIWEAMAAAYTVFTKDRSLSVEAKKEAFHLLLNRSMNNEQGVLNEVPLNFLKRVDVVALLTAFETVAGAKGWWIK